MKSVINVLRFIYKTENQFGKMVESMSAADSWTYRNWKGLLEDQLSSWMMYIPGVSGSKDAAAVKEVKGERILIYLQEMVFLFRHSYVGRLDTRGTR